MTQAMTSVELQDIYDSIDRRGVNAAIEAYQTLYDKGYNYAGWAQGVATGKAFTGQAALAYLKNTALIGLGDNKCTNMSQQQIDKIRVEMAMRTIEEYQKIAKSNNGILDRDLYYKETKEIHKDIYDKNNLNLDSWTLNLPMELFRKEFGDQVVEHLWRYIRDTGGDGLDAAWESSLLKRYMTMTRNSQDPETQRKIDAWLDEFDIPSAWDILFDTLAANLEPTRFKDIIMNLPMLPMMSPMLYATMRDLYISNTFAQTASAALTIPRRDPLVFDLDGDGIETTGREQTILFDHNADGIKTGTGWLSGDDGWLALDKSGNGAIDSGRELFGVDTLKANGQPAADGFDALKELDSNQDGQINSADPMFANLRIWRDLNQDGISQEGELSTLAANHISSIGVNANNVRTDLGNGNIQNAAASYTKDNGQTGTAGATINNSSNSNSNTVANLDLLSNTFQRQFTNRITLTDQAKTLPSLRGSGQVRDLNEAVSLSPELGSILKSYSEQTSRQSQLALLDTLLEKWANTSSMQSLPKQAAALGSTVNYNLSGLTQGTAAYFAFISKMHIVEKLPCRLN